MQTSDHSSVMGIGVSELVDEYHRRRLAEMSDAVLIRRVADIVAQPRREPPSSFVLHAPLELAARARLLPLVQPAQRELARLHIVAIAAQYEAAGPAVEIAEQSTAGSAHDGSTQPLIEAITAGDMSRVEAEAAALARSMAPHDLVAALVDTVTPLTAAAGHAPIFFDQLLRGDGRNGVTVQLLRPLARDLARHPTWRISWVDGWTAAGDTDPTTLGTTLATTPRLGLSGSAFIHPLMQNVDASGAAADRLGNVVGRHDPESARTILRCAAQSMLQDTPEHAPYGWSHCLTIPQAVLGIAPLADDPHRSLAIAATQVMAFRTALGAAQIDLTAEAPNVDIDQTRLAVAAATSHDAHVVKYTLACFDAAADDPSHATLYLAAARRLLDVWIDRGGDPTDPLTAV